MWSCNMLGLHSVVQQDKLLDSTEKLVEYTQYGVVHRREKVTKLGLSLRVCNHSKSNHSLNVFSTLLSGCSVSWTMMGARAWTLMSSRKVYETTASPSKRAWVVLDRDQFVVLFIAKLWHCVHDCWLDCQHFCHECVYHAITVSVNWDHVGTSHCSQ